MRSRLIFLGIGLVVGAVLASAAFWAHGLRTSLVDTSPTGGAWIDTADPKADYLFKAANLCVDGRGTATITKVRPILSQGSLGDVEIAEFQFGLPDNSGEIWRKLKPGETLDAWYEDVDTNNDLKNWVSGECEPSLYAQRTLAVRLKVSQLPSGLDGVLIDYKVNGITKTLRSNVGLALCTGDEKPDDEPSSDQTDQKFNMLPACWEE